MSATVTVVVTVLAILGLVFIGLPVYFTNKKTRLIIIVVAIAGILLSTTVAGHWLLVRIAAIFGAGSEVNDLTAAPAWLGFIGVAVIVIAILTSEGRDRVGIIFGALGGILLSASLGSVVIPWFITHGS